MARRQIPANDNDDISPSASSSFGNFQFTFNCSAANSFIEPDPDAEDISDSESLTDSVQNFPEEFGRTYHAYRAGSYAFPNDQLERERLELQNEALVKLFNGRLFFAPLSKNNPPRNILDIATGTGDWAIKMGDEYPNSEVIATDLSPIQPENVPPNVSFYVEDSGEPWDYSHQFDYIHTRVTAGCWSNFQEQVAQQAFESLVPGGYFESQEFDAIIACDDDTLTEDMPIAKWFHDLRTAAESIDRPVVVAQKLREAYQAVGFVDVQERVFKMPMNGWPKDERLKELGRMWERNFVQGLSGFSFSLFHRVFGRTPAETEVMLVDVRRDFTDTRIHAYVPVYVVTGRKPFPGEGPIPPIIFR
ncbi:Fc.00g102650.m01.CDS01 [Cosmosporella sp. VM-42]